MALEFKKQKPIKQNKPAFFNGKVLIALVLCVILVSIVYLWLSGDNRKSMVTTLFGSSPQTQQSTKVSEVPISELDAPIRDLLKSMVKIPSGTFHMGSNLGDIYEEPVHTVTLSGFEIGAFEVTQAQYEAIMGKYANPSKFIGPNTQNYPVQNVSWKYAMSFCDKLSTKTGRVFTLPTEAQWEYACRAGSTGNYCFGDDENMLGEYAWYEKNSYDRESGNHPHPVGTLKPNAWGLYDMHGNVSEWCLDSGHRNYDGAPSDGSAWETPREYSRVLRGGCYYFEAKLCRSNRRGNLVPESHDDSLGFRVVLVNSVR